MPLSPSDLASHLAALHDQEFDEKSSGRFLISKEELRRLSGRERLESVIVQRVSEALLNDYSLVMLQLDGFFGIVKENDVLRWRQVPRGVVSKQAKRKPNSGRLAIQTVLNPAAAWPFPTGSRP